MAIAYLDCFAGISGDMLLGAMIDAGLPAAALRRELSKLVLEGYKLGVQRTSRAGLAATQAVVEIKEEPQHRGLADVIAIIDRSSLPASDKEKGLAVFRRLAEAEARVHGRSPDDVVLHELGSLDTVVDVMGAVGGLRLLGVDQLYSSPLPLGSGTVRSAHGLLPVPAPATLALLADAGAPTTGDDRPGELVTPTGAALVSTLAKFERPAMHLSRVGCGAGSRDPKEFPNILRLWLGEQTASPTVTLLIETNIDDMTPEMLGYLQEQLFAAGAADVWFTPIQMKKNRPAVTLSTLCVPDKEHEIARLLLRESSTLGIRVSEVRRHEARREHVTFPSSLGPVSIKVKWLEAGEPQVHAEYEDCRRLAQESRLPIADVYRIVESEGLAWIKERGAG